MKVIGILFEANQHFFLMNLFKFLLLTAHFLDKTTEKLNILSLIIFSYSLSHLSPPYLILIISSKIVLKVLFCGFKFPL
jgi:hypothetical protein